MTTVTLGGVLSEAPYCFLVCINLMEIDMKASELSKLSSELKECPFCGCKASLESVNQNHWRVRCKSDHCGGTNWVQFEPDKACEVWNNRK